MATTDPRQIDLFRRHEVDSSLVDRGAQPTSSALRPLETDAEALALKLNALTHDRVRTLALTDNRTRIVSARASAHGEFAVRIHRCFTEASRETLRAVADFVTGRARGSGRRKVLAVIRRHFESHRSAPSTRPPIAQAPSSSKQRTRRIVPQTVGRFVDLRQICDDLNRRYFDGQLRVEITWGRAPTARRRRRRRGFSIRLGSYSADQRLVRVHRALDRREVPLYVIESIVYHEMLHAAVPPLPGRGRRRRLHTPEFRRRERLYPDFERAQRWIEQHLARLAGID